MDKIYTLKGTLFSSLSKIRRRFGPACSLGIFLMFLSFGAYAQTNTVIGTVRDTKGETIPGASVKVKGTTNAASTDEGGKYVIKNVPKNSVLLFTSIGYLPKEVPAKDGIVDVIMQEETKSLNEVLIVGYGKQKQTELTGAVAQIGAEQIVKTPSINSTNALIGKLPGLLAVQTSGQPGLDASTITIRGVATYNDASAIVVVDGIERPSFGDIDPNVIESVTILKDAASTAIYGIKGANGVIVVTTKQGIISAPKVTYTGNYALQTYTGLPFSLDSYDNARLLNQAYANDGKAAPWSAAELQKFQDHSDPYGYPDVQWFKYLTNKFYYQTQHNVSVRGGTKFATYFVSGGYSYQDGIFKKFPSPYGINTVPDYTRYNFTSNLDFNLNKDLTVGLKLNGILSNRYQPAGLLSSSAFSYDTIEGMISRILQVPAFAYPVTLPDGRIAQNPSVGTNLWNPLAVLTRFGTRNDDNNKFNSTFNFNYKLNFITKGLSFKTDYAYDSYFSNTERRNANWAAYVWDRTTGNISLSTDTRNRDVPLGAIVASAPSGSTNTTLHTGFDYNRSFGQHNISALVLGTRALIMGPPDPNVSNSLFASPPHAAQGVVGRVKYNFDERYYLEAVASYNGSENFQPSSYGKSHQYGFFPAISGGYTLTNEPFFNKNDILQYLKFRGSWGKVGNDKGIGRFSFLTSYSANGSPQFGSPSSPVSYPTLFIDDGNLGNPDITWETGIKRNIGLDARLFKNKVKVTLDVFDEDRKNILTDPQNTLADFGHSYPALNSGEVYNKGYEIELDYQTKIGQVMVGINAQLSYAHNIIKSDSEAPTVPANQALQGHSVGQFYGYVSEGFYKNAADIASSVPQQGVTPIPGDLKFKDINGDGVINSLDQQPIGYTNTPEYVYSFSPRVSYKGFSFSVLVQGVAHVSSNVILTDQNNGQQMYPFMENAWTPATAETATWPALHSRGYTGLNNTLNSFNIQNARYIKIRNTEIAYTLPKRWTDPLKLAGVRVFLNGQNLYTWTPFKMYLDPENLNVVNQAFPLQSVYPSSRVFNIGANISF